MSKKMRYKNTYYDVVKPENLASIKTVLNEQEIYDPDTVAQIQYQEENNLPYLLVHDNSGMYLSGSNYGMLSGVFVNIEVIYPKWSGVFYLPLIFLRQPTNPKVKEIVETKHAKEHELGHLKHIIEYIDANPSYIERALKFSVSGCTLKDLRLSIEFEVEKIFKQELPLLVQDYQLGETSIAINVDGVGYEIETDNEQRFLQYQIGLYVGSLFEQYLQRFPEHKELIGELYKKEVNAQGRILYGENAIVRAALSVADLFSQRFNPLKATRLEIGEIK